MAYVHVGPSVHPAALVMLVAILLLLFVIALRGVTT